jgi:hypothetical protein
VAPTDTGSEHGDRHIGDYYHVRICHRYRNEILTTRALLLLSAEASGICCMNRSVSNVFSQLIFHICAVALNAFLTAFRYGSLLNNNVMKLNSVMSEGKDIANQVLRFDNNCTFLSFI